MKILGKGAFDVRLNRNCDWCLGHGEEQGWAGYFSGNVGVDGTANLNQLKVWAATSLDGSVNVVRDTT